MLWFFNIQSLPKSMSMASIQLPLLFLPLLFIASAYAGGTIGLNYGRVANNLPSPDKVVELLKAQGINRVKLYDTNSVVLMALANSGIHVVVALPNELLSHTASNQLFADNWVQANIRQYYPATKIEAIAVGNEVFVDPKNTTPFLVPAMKNVYNSLVKFNLSSIKVSSPIAFSALKNSYPSSSGSFKPELIESVMKPMLEFLRQTRSFLMINAYPFFAYSANADVISLDYVLFKENPGVVDSGNGLLYTSLLDAQVDAVFAAMSAIQYNDIKMVVTETGWPSMGDENEIGASVTNAALYNGNLVKRVLKGTGTPLRPQDPLNVYLFALFNEDMKPGPTSERNYGLFLSNEQKVYDIPLTLGELESGQSTPVNGSNAYAPASGNGGDMPGKAVHQTWCVASENVGEEKLLAGIEYACRQGGADCRGIQPGGTCYNQTTLVARASYAFNSYYQKKGRAAGTCDFGGASYVVTQAPRFGTCDGY